MIQRLFRFTHDGIDFEFLRDCRMTMVIARAEGRIMVGTAFCIKEDKYDVGIGCRVAMQRLCRNLKFKRAERLEFQEALDAPLETYLIGKSIDRAIKELTGVK